ncbi:hypothetical protein A2239_00700 [Candidatus Uhrbacteria bacterium RIFOXYA2_FULL_40_9]|nr:MAG: MutS2 protein [Candidatus Uhrbacteria bacterium GW2011_GWF2_40_263]OGL92646.1 MAG: hypothetical protein A2239_00700 [Candidatus Uhrbacteria bacterium RIFOXYA2_FULL_40_9]OGL96708.1 MAG: hypothetical protein A2332_02610 [Candidatus Uhrbacteria bacterium RIFOXYB2_FULL_41_18]HBK34681.1 hypothetical protein [Candidatus Uhrbacteria bacterium]HCB56083.1 hypothetical protein [Candidatus Uhrbacteria bacterium]
MKDTSPLMKDTSSENESLFLFAEMGAAPKIDLHGMFVEQALQELDQFLHHAFIEKDQIVTIIHGCGTGALQKAVHTHLSTIPFVREYRLSERSLGVTQVIFALS